MPEARKPELTEAEWAWVAGLFEGEGCVNFPSGSSCVRLVVKMTDRDVIEHLSALLTPGGKGIFYKESRSPDKDLYEWAIAQRDYVHHVMTRLYPYMGSRRRARFDEAFERLLKNTGKAGPPPRDFCRRGHQMIGDNVLMKKGGRRNCRACARLMRMAREA